jgi:hypothetical protein
MDYMLKSMLFCLLGCLIWRFEKEREFDFCEFWRVKKNTFFFGDEEKEATVPVPS